MSPHFLTETHTIHHTPSHLFVNLVSVQSPTEFSPLGLVTVFFWFVSGILPHLKLVGPFVLSLSLFSLSLGHLQELTSEVPQFDTRPCQERLHIPLVRKWRPGPSTCRSRWLLPLTLWWLSVACDDEGVRRYNKVLFLWTEHEPQRRRRKR